MSRRPLMSMALLVLAAVLWFGGAGAAQAQSPPTVTEVRVSGNLRVEKDAILQQVRTRAGAALDARTLGDDIRNVHDLGYFDDVLIDAESGPDGLVLTFVVTEKPLVKAVRFTGNDELDKEDIQEVVDLKAGSIFNESDIRDNRRKIEELYREKGYYLVDVSYRVERDGQGEVVVVYTIREFSRVEIARVSFVGNENIADKDIQEFIQTRPRDYLSFLTDMGTFQREGLQADLQRIRLLYFDRGYLDVSVGDPLVELGRDRRSVTVTFPIREGKPYRVLDVSVSGDLLESQQDTMKRVRMTAGETFSASVLRNDMQRITAWYKDQGYAFVNVNPLTRQDPEALTIGIQYDIQKGELAYIGRIEVVGNTLTRDLVVRRELDIAEGDRYSTTRIERSRAWVERLGFFEKVTVREETSRTNPQLVDLQIEVVERPTRSFQVGAGFASSESFFATATISENNLFGRGQSMSLFAQLSSIRTLVVLSFVEPYLFDTNWQLNLDLYNRQEVYQVFERQARGAEWSFGYRPFRSWEGSLFRDVGFSLGYQIEDVEVVPVAGFSGGDIVILRQEGLTSGLTGGVYWDGRNNRLLPTKGFYQSVNVEVADGVFGSDNEFWRLRAISRWYAEPLWPGWVFKLNTEFGYIGSTDPEKRVPIFERFYLGGPNSVRGFPRLWLSPTLEVGRTLDPFERTRAFPYGGNKRLSANLELEFPLLTSIGLRGVVFTDAGQAYDNDQPLSLRLDVFEDIRSRDDAVLRTAWGFGLRWRSPIGPLRFEWGFPLNRLSDEESMVFEFSIGDPF